MKTLKFEIFITLFAICCSFYVGKSNFKTSQAGTFCGKTESNITLSDLARVMESGVMQNFYKN